MLFATRWRGGSERRSHRSGLPGPYERDHAPWRTHGRKSGARKQLVSVKVLQTAHDEAGQLINVMEALPALVGEWEMRRIAQAWLEGYRKAYQRDRSW